MRTPNFTTQSLTDELTHIVHRLPDRSQMEKIFMPSGSKLYEQVIKNFKEIEHKFYEFNTRLPLLLNDCEEARETVRNSLDNWVMLFYNKVLCIIEVPVELSLCNFNQLLQCLFNCVLAIIKLVKNCYLKVHKSKDDSTKKYSTMTLPVLIGYCVPRESPWGFTDIFQFISQDHRSQGNPNDILDFITLFMKMLILFDPPKRYKKRTEKGAEFLSGCITDAATAPETLSKTLTSTLEQCFVKHKELFDTELSDDRKKYWRDLLSEAIQKKLRRSASEHINMPVMADSINNVGTPSPYDQKGSQLIAGSTIDNFSELSESSSMLETDLASYLTIGKTNGADVSFSHLSTDQDGKHQGDESYIVNPIREHNKSESMNLPNSYDNNASLFNENRTHHEESDSSAHLRDSSIDTAPPMRGNMPSTAKRARIENFVDNLEQPNDAFFENLLVRFT